MSQVFSDFYETNSVQKYLIGCIFVLQCQENDI